MTHRSCGRIVRRSGLSWFGFDLPERGGYGFIEGLVKLRRKLAIHIRTICNPLLLLCFNLRKPTCPLRYFRNKFGFHARQINGLGMQIGAVGHLIGQCLTSHHSQAIRNSQLF